MNVSSFGPEGYEYQYLASVYLILRIANDKVSSFVYIEKLDSEDLSILFEDNKRFEVQFKKRKDVFGLEELAGCLTKFDPRSSNSNTVSKLKNDEINELYIFTNAHADTFAREVGVLAKVNSFSRYAANAPGKWNGRLSSAISLQCSKKTTTLAKNRNTFIVAQSKEFSEKDAESKIFSKVLLIDRHDDLTLISNISALMSSFDIPFSHHQTVTDLLLRIIKDNRANGVDILPIIKGTIDKFARVMPMEIERYIPIGNEEKLIHKLGLDRRLLFTGSTLCGKTQTALHVCRNFLQDKKGADYLATSSVYEAESFLLASVSEDRLVLIEDPFGQKFTNGNFSIAKKIEFILEHIAGRTNRYFVLTSNDKALVPLFLYSKELPWKDLTVRDPSKLIDYWYFIGGAVSGKMDLLSKELIQLLESEPKEHLPQCGQLDYLLANRDQLSNINSRVIKHILNFQVNDIVEQIKKFDIEVIETLLLFSICCTTNRGITMVDLQYIFASSEDYFPGFIEKESNLGTFFLGRGNKAEQRLEEYEEFLLIPKEVQYAIQRLTDLGFIYEQSGVFRFKHPIYEEASRSLLNCKENSFRFLKMLEILRKVISGLNEELALNSINSMYISQRYLVNDEVKSAQVCDVVGTALYSTFVNVRENGLYFLAKHYPLLSSDLGKKVVGLVRNRGYFSHDFYWHGNIPYIPKKPHPSASSGIFDRLAMRLAGAKKWKKLFNLNIYLRPQDADLALENVISRTEVQGKRIGYPIGSLIPFLRYKEFFIREQAGFIIAGSLTDKNFERYQQVLIEDNPLIKYQLLRGLFRAWPYFLDEEIKKQVMDVLVSYLGDHFVSLLAVDFFTQFGAGYGPASFTWGSEIEKTAIPSTRKLWADLTPAFTKSLPRDVHIHTPRFYTTLLESDLDDTALSEVISYWISWLKIHIEDRLWLDDVAETVINIFRSKIEMFSLGERSKNINILYEFDNGLFQAHVVRSLFSKWAVLDEAERKHLNDHVTLHQQFLRPIALTSVQAIEQLKLVIPEHDIKKVTAKLILDGLGNELIMQCMVQLYIYPPTADLPFAGCWPWNTILAGSLLTANEDLFKISFQVFVRDKAYPGRFGNINWPSMKALMANVLFSEYPQIFGFIFDVLLEDLLENNGSETTKFWGWFFDVIDGDARLLYTERILEVIEGISRYHDNIKCIPDKIFKEHISPQLSVEQAVYQLVNMSPDVEINKNVAIYLMHIIKHEKIRLQISISRVRDWCRDNKELFNDEENKMVEEYFNKFFEKCRQQSSSHRKKLENHFSKWFPVWTK